MNPSEDFINKLFSVIRIGLDLEINSDSYNYSNETLLEIISFGAQQSILPIVLKGVKQINSKLKIPKDIDVKNAKCLYQSVQHDQYINVLGSVLSYAKIPYILLKGAVIRDLYPDKDLRTSCDLDILVRSEDVNTAVSIIEKETDFVKTHDAYHNASLRNKTTHLELHFTLKENQEKIDSVLDLAWDYAYPTGNGSMYAFTPEYQVFYVLAHMAHHFLNGGLGIRPFIDIWMLRNRTSFDESLVLDLCGKAGLSKFYVSCCLLSDVWLSNKQHTTVTKMMEEAALSGGVYGSKSFNYAVRQKKYVGAKYIASRIFPPPYQVREFYKDENNKKHCILYYYFKRLRSWLSKNRRKELKNQLDNIRATDKEQITFVNALIKELDL